MTPAQFWQIEMQNQQNQQEQKQQQQQQIMQGIGGLVEAYVGQQTQKAQTKAFGDVLEMHGPTIFGEGAIGLLDRYKKGNQQEQLAMMNFMGGQLGQQLGRQQYLSQQAEAFGGRSGGTGGGGAQPFYTVQ
jgi:hypothetical protein